VGIQSVESATGTPCAISNFELVQDPAGGPFWFVNTDISVAPGDTTYNPSGYAIRMIETGVPQDECKGATVNLVIGTTTVH
jgi:hypothetical protein